MFAVDEKIGVLRICFDWSFGILMAFRVGIIYLRNQIYGQSKKKSEFIMIHCLERGLDYPNSACPTPSVVCVLWFLITLKLHRP